jgi:hypothetical protein
MQWNAVGNTSKQVTFNAAALAALAPSSMISFALAVDIRSVSTGSRGGFQGGPPD